MQKTINKENEEVIIASITYLSCIIPMFGLFIPLLIWLIKKDLSFFLTFHTLQNIVYQSCGVVILSCGMLMYVLSFFIVFIGAFATAIVSSGKEPDPIFFIFFFLPFIVFFLMIFIFFLYSLYAIIGFFVILAKKDFKYLLIGKLLEKHLLTQTTNANNMSESC